MKNYLVILMLLAVLILSGCEMLYPEQNTPTPQPVITFTPIPITAEPAPTVPVTEELNTDPTMDNFDLPVIKSTIVNISDYMSGNSYKGGAGFRDAVNVEYITSSSYLASQAGNTYEADNLYDFSLDTVWCEGKTNYGIGEWALYSVKAQDYAPNAIITDIEIINGYIKTDDLYKDNSMAKKILVSIDDVDICILKLDKSNRIQQFDVPDIDLSTTDAKAIKFEILEVYEGDVYADTCITAIEFAGTGIY